MFFIQSLLKKIDFLLQKLTSLCEFSVGPIERVHFGSQGDIRYQIRRILVVQLLRIDSLHPILHSLLLQILQHRLPSLQHQRKHLLQLRLRQSRADLLPQVLPRRVPDAEQIPHANAILLLGTSKIPVCKVIEVANENLFNDIRIPQHETGLVEDVKAENLPVVLCFLVDLAQMGSGSCSEEDAVFEIAEEPVAVGKLVDSAIRPIRQLFL